MANGRRGGGGGKTAPQQCPDCGSEMWDNSLTKRTPKQPDYVCKQRNGECNGAVWLDNKTRNAEQGMAQGSGAPVAARPVVIDGLYFYCMKAARTILEKLATDGLIAEGFTLNHQISVANALFDKRMGSNPGILKAEKDLVKPAPPPPPPPPPPPQQEPDDGLPF